MKCLFTKIVTILFCLIPAVSFAGWQVATPNSAIPNEPFFQGGTQPDSSATAYGASGFPNQFSNFGRPAALYAISVSGSVKDNLERIMDRYHWKVIWKSPYDYNFDGRITGSSLPDVVEKLLKPFPLQAQMFMSNRTMIIIQRKL